MNSLRARLERVGAWLDREAPDVVCLQETKATDDKFPREVFEDRGYDLEVFGQPTYNGVCIAAKAPYALEDVQRGFPDASSDAEKRLIAATVGGLRLVNVYVPNGSSVGSDKFEYKLRWYARLRKLLDDTADPDTPWVICGDFNVAPDDRDVHAPDAYRGAVMFSDEEKAAYQRLKAFGLADVLRHFSDEAGVYTWWDYRRLGFQKNRGWRIDHFLATPPAVERARSIRVNRDERKGPQPSDHAPVIATFTDA